MATDWAQSAASPPRPTDRLCSAETAPLQFRCSADPFPAALSGFGRSLHVVAKPPQILALRGKAPYFKLRGTQESNLTLRFWRPPRHERAARLSETVESGPST